MAFKLKGFNPGVGTGMGSSPNKIKGKIKPRPIKPSVTSSPNKISKNEYELEKKKMIKQMEELRLKGDFGGMVAIGGKLADLSKTVTKGGDYVKPGGKITGSMKDFALGSEERKAEYDRRGWKYDDTIAGYNKDGSKKEQEAPTNEPESDPTPDPTEPKQDDITEPEYDVASQKGRKTTSVKRRGDNVMAYEHTDRNIGDKEVFTGTGHEKGDVRHKKKYNKKGKQTKDKKKYTLPDGTVVKVKNKRGKNKVKIRKKGQIFSRRVDPSELENMDLPKHDESLEGYK